MAGIDPLTLLLYIFVVVLLVAASAWALQHHMAAIAAAVSTTLSATINRALSQQSQHKLPDLAPAPSLREECFPWCPTAVIRPLAQRQLGLQDSAAPGAAHNDSGEACAAMCIRAARGVSIAPEALWIPAIDRSTTGVLPAQSLVDILRRNTIRSHEYQGSGAAAILMLTACTDDGRPVLCLGTWPTPPSRLQWVLAIYAEEDGTIGYINPWGGIITTATREQWHAASAESYVVLDSHLLFA